MPFSNHSSLVALLLKQLWEGLLTTIKGLGVVGEAISMAVFTSEHTST